MLAPGPSLRVEPLPFDHPVSTALVAQIQEFYVDRYGAPDETPVAPGEFDPPHGRFLLAYDGSTPVGCGAWRVLEPGLAEVKRMFVLPEYRRRGVSRVLLAALEDSARAAGASRLWLQTGSLQGEALGLYRSSPGWEPIAPYGFYAEHPGCHCFGKSLG
ncbi:MAG: GNAT family N-acetyltransferase [Sporichthyaceae bacterium]